MIAQGRSVEAAQYLQVCLVKASEAGWGYGEIAARLLLAVTADTPGAGLTLLTESINQAKPEKFLRSFIEVGEPLIPLLHKAALYGLMAKLRDLGVQLISVNFDLPAGSSKKSKDHNE